MNSTLVSLVTVAIEKGLVPTTVTRRAIRRLCAERQAELDLPEAELEEATRRFLAALADSPIAVATAAANEQHYEVPATFYLRALGDHLKYSSCYWPEGVETLTEAEEAALTVTLERAGVADGHRVLEMGCGWGSLTLFMAERVPGARITAVSNSASQREFILARARERGLENLGVVTSDMNRFEPGEQFDRIVSVEMFEHMRNWPSLYDRVASWLKPEGRFFKHVFCHRHTPYFYEDRGPQDWMARHFFTGGIMPSFDLPGRVSDALEVESSWKWDGTHYQKTADAWLENADAHRDELIALLDRLHDGEGRRWFERWRVFFLACSELFGFDEGREWFVGHYLLKRSDG